MSVSSITDRQSEVLAFIVSFWKEHSTSPTYRSIAEHFQIQVNAVSGHVAALREKGFLKPQQKENGSRMARSIIPVDMPTDAVQTASNWIIQKIDEDRIFIAIFSESTILYNGIESPETLAEMARNNGIESGSPLETAEKLAAKFLPRLLRKLQAA